MNILIADDEVLVMEDIYDKVKKLRPDDNIKGFSRPSQVLEYIKDNSVDIAFLDINMGSVSGIEIARKIKHINPAVNIIFITAYSEYAMEAIGLRCSGYLMKPVNDEDLERELDMLRNPVETQNIRKQDSGLYFKCFGNFDILYNGVPLKFERIKSKELIAYLIDQRGSSVTANELCSALWENSDNDAKNMQYLQKLKRDLIKTLKSCNSDEVFIHTRNNYAVDPNMIACDYYDYIDGRPEGIRAYNGQYMNQYSWAEVTKANLINEN